mgnify:CR=1 FL=1
MAQNIGSMPGKAEILRKPCFLVMNLIETVAKTGFFERLRTDKGYATVILFVAVVLIVAILIYMLLDVYKFPL